jgi:hypothetical protein
MGHQVKVSPKALWVAPGVLPVLAWVWARSGQWQGD